MVGRSTGGPTLLAGRGLPLPVGQPPFRKETEVAVIQAHLVEEGPRRVDGEAGECRSPSTACWRLRSRRNPSRARRAQVRSRPLFESRSSGRVAPPQPSRSKLPISSRRLLTFPASGELLGAEGLELPAELPEELVEFFAGVPRLVVPDGLHQLVVRAEHRVSGSRSWLSMPTRQTVSSSASSLVPGPGSGHRPGGGRCRCALPWSTMYHREPSRSSAQCSWRVTAVEDPAPTRCR